MSSERETLKRAFLDKAGLADARREPLAGDASTRAYERLWRADGSSLILMDQPPSAESAPCPPEALAAEREALGYNAMYRLAAGRVDAFTACAQWLTEQGLSAPRIVAADASNGLAVLEDMGDGLYARLIAEGAADEGELYDAAIDCLLLLHGKTPPDVLPGGWPLLTYDTLALVTGQNVFIDWLPKFRDLAFDEAAFADWERLWAPMRARAEAGATVFCLRDYHAENLIWLPERQGAARVGLLDFQDALKAHPVWDLSMLLHDARRDVSPAQEAACLGRYLNLGKIKEPAAFLADYHAIGALNIVRIIGVFARLVVRDGKPRYASFMPRMWRYLDHCLEQKGMEDLRAWFDAHVPEEARR